MSRRDDPTPSRPSGLRQSSQHTTARLSLVGLAWLVCGAAPGSAQEVVLDGIAAQVGSEIVLLSDVERTAGPVEQRMREAGAPPSQFAMMRAEALERLIEGKIIDGVVKRTELTATEDEVNGAIGMIAREAGLTYEQILQSVSSHGMTLEQYRSQIKSEIERSKVINAMVRPRVHIEPDEVYNMFLARYGDQPERGGEQLHLRHILVSAGPGAMRSLESACKELEVIRSRILSGDTNFDQAARAVSDFKSEVGGDLGWMNADDLASWMVPPISSLASGQMTPVLPMAFGCNLLMLVDRRNYKPITFEDIQPKLEAELYEQKTGEEYALWVEKLRSQTYIERKGAFAETTRLQTGPGGLGSSR